MDIHHFKKAVSVHMAPHLLCCRALEVQKYVCAPAPCFGL